MTAVLPRTDQAIAPAGLMASAVAYSLFIADGGLVPVGSVSDTDRRWTLWFDANPIEAIASASPCWGATPCVAVTDQRLYVDYVAPTGRNHGEMSMVHRCSDNEQARYEAGELGGARCCW